MTAPPPALSRLELVVLSRLGSKTSTSLPALGKAVRELAARDAADTLAADTFDALCTRGLAIRRQRARLRTEAGNHALRQALGIATTPAWRDVRDTHLPRLALAQRGGVAPPVLSAEAIAIALLRARHALPDATTVAELGDALLREALGMPPGPLSLTGLRAHVLGRRLERPIPEGRKLPLHLADLALDQLGAPRPAPPRGYKATLTRALVRDWVTAHAPQLAGPPPAAAPAPATAAVPRPPAPPSSALLDAVRASLARVGAHGRVGPEKVFVSAVWHVLTAARAQPDLSLDRFKRWLLTANREGKLLLARADITNTLDRKLLTESEIEDQGATFHFVIDRGSATHGRAAHAR
jgi:hypothetical protein